LHGSTPGIHSLFTFRSRSRHLSGLWREESPWLGTSW
jgi:hypothetical protein